MKGRLVSLMGQVYRVSRRNYIRILRAIHDGEEYSLEEMGRCLGHVENLTDMTPMWADALLEEEGPD